MPSTRHAAPGTDPAAAPERYLSSDRVRGIAVGAHIVARIARHLPADERAAMLWLTAYAKLLDLTADSLSDQLDLDRTEIREALTNPDQDRARFVRQVADLRKRFERGLATPRRERTEIPQFKSRVFREAACALADTKVRRKVRNAISFAERHDEPQIVEIQGETRLGKTVCAAHEFFRRLDHAAWFTVPTLDDQRSFLIALCQSLGASVSTADKNSHLLSKIEACIGPNRISTLFVEEAHRLWPKNLTNQPKRLDHLRDWWEYHGLSIVILATPQWQDKLTEAAGVADSKWECGQWLGRAQPYDLPGSLTRDDLRAIAANHAPEADAATLDQLVTHAVASRGYAGAMVKAIERTRVRPGGITLGNVQATQIQIDRAARKTLVPK